MKRSLVSLSLFALLPLGLMLVAVTPWGFAVAAIPIVAVCIRFLVFIHKSLWAALFFWVGLAFLSWQIALAAGVVTAVVYYVVLILKSPGVAPEAEENHSAFKWDDEWIDTPHFLREADAVPQPGDKHWRFDDPWRIEEPWVADDH